MPDASIKLARDLETGDQVLVHVRGNKTQGVPGTVLAVVPSVQTIKRNVLMVTVRTKDGRDLHRTYWVNHPMRIVE